jgi:hypothetical protein
LIYKGFLYPAKSLIYKGFIILLLLQLGYNSLIGEIMFDRMPLPTSEVEITTRHKEMYYLATDEYRDTVYLGKVISPPYPIANTEFALQDKSMPFGHRIINLRHVVGLKMIKGVTKPVKQETKIVHIEVPGSKGNTYHVTNESGRWTCTCAGFQFRRQCKHTQNVGIS